MVKTLFKILFSLSLLFSVVYGVVFHEDIFSIDIEKKVKQIKKSKVNVESITQEKKLIINETAWFVSEFKN